jgi:hypothetical protein
VHTARALDATFLLCHPRRRFHIEWGGGGRGGGGGGGGGIATKARHATCRVLTKPTKALVAPATHETSLLPSRPLAQSQLIGRCGGRTDSSFAASIRAAQS